jgi:hypothetical protein
VKLSLERLIEYSTERSARCHRFLGSDPLEQIRIQAEGPISLTRLEIQRRLNIGPDQAELIGALLADGEQEMIRVSTLPPNVLPDNYNDIPPEKRLALLGTKEVKPAIDKCRETALKVRGAVNQRIAKVLTRKQREAFQRMQGEPFDFAKVRAGARPPVSEPQAATKAP